MWDNHLRNNPTERFLRDELLITRRRRRQLLGWKLLFLLSLLATLFVTILLFTKTSLSVSGVRTSAVLLGSLAAMLALVASRTNQSLVELARWIETKQPEIGQRLLTTVSRWERSPQQSPGYLERVVAEEAASVARHTPWRNLVSRQTMWAWSVSAVTLATFCMLGLAWLAVRQPPPAGADATAMEALATELPELVVEPGDTEVEKGTSFVASARFGKEIPRDVELIVNWASGETQRLPMTRRLEDPLFAVYLPSVNQPFTYRVAFRGNASHDYRVDVFQFPELTQADAALQFPSYTGLEPKDILDSRRVSAVEGTDLTWTLHLNKPVARAWLETAAGERVDLAQDSGDATAYRLRTKLASDQRWKLRLEDSEGRPNRVQDELSVHVVANRPPELKPVAARDQSVSPLEELEVAAKYWDDFGVTRYGVSYALAADPLTEHQLGEQLAAQEATTGSYLLSFEAMQAEPDQLLAYHFWAEDIGPDGTPRRTQSDLYFAEVRHFEEIFREGESPGGEAASQPPPSAGNQNTQQAEQLLEIQKQIVTASWNLLRREAGATISTAFQEDVAVVHQSQADALEQLSEMQSQLEDAESLRHLTETQGAMSSAANLLLEAKEQNAAAPLQTALASEQLAYQYLLKLRAREHEVVRSNASSSSSSSSSAGAQQRQQQLDQLELKNDRNRYETQRQASQESEQQAQRQEVQQIINRLKDLARRQEDINQQLKELQAALQQAETAEQREEIERVLKRLRDQQQELLRDTDEAAERVDQSSNPADMQETRQQMDQTREQIQQSAEATERGELPQALTAGTRAERQFRDMSDQLRQQSAEQFTEQLQTMRDQARELEATQQRLQQEMQPEPSRQQPGLRTSADQNELADSFRGQQERLRDLMEEMQQTVQEAETSEPLLAQKLYDTYRAANQNQVEQRLSETERLLTNGLRNEAAEREQQAAEGIRQLRQGVEDAAESILGDELEGLRRAAGELAELAEALNREVSQFDSQETTQNNGPDDGPDAEQSAEQGETAADSTDRPRGGSESPSDSSDTSNSRASQGSESDPQSSDGQGLSNRRQSRSQQAGQSPEQQDPQSGQQQPSDQQPSDQQPSDQQPNDQQPNDQQPSDQQTGGQQSGQQQPGQQQLSQQQQPSQQRQSGQQQQPGGQQTGQATGGQQAQREGGGGLSATAESLGSGPLTGESFSEWSNRLRDVENMVDDPDLRARAAQIRDRARNVRRELQRGSEQPRWDLVRELIAQPLDELRTNVEQELARRSGQREQLVPIDQDPVPNEFEERVRRYYEQLGQGE